MRDKVSFLNAIKHEIAMADRDLDSDEFWEMIDKLDEYLERVGTFGIEDAEDAEDEEY